MLVKGEECSRDGSGVCEGDAEAVFDVPQEFGSFTARLFFYLDVDVDVDMDRRLVS